MKRVLSATALLIAIAIASSCVDMPEAVAGDLPASDAPTRVAVLVREEWRFADGGLDQYALCVWDETLSRKLTRTLYDASFADPVQKTVYVYEGGLLVLESTKDQAGKPVSSRKYEYDAAGRLSAETTNNAAGKAISVTRYGYDGAGRREVWAAYDGTGALIAKTVYHYDASGRRTFSETFDSGGTVLVRTEDKYEKSGRLLSRTVRGRDPKKDAAEIWAYAAGGLSTKTETRGGVATLRTDYLHDVEGNLLKMTVYDSKGAIREVRTYHYAFRAIDAAA